MRALRYVLLAVAAFCVYAGVAGMEPFSDWSVNSLILAAAALLMLFFRFEEGEYGSREVAVVGALSAVGAAGRVLFAALPGVQPVTFIAVLAGYVFGAEPGFMVGALSALLSNIFLGQGPWTPWQMLGWGLAGASGGLLSAALGRRVRVAPIAVLCFSWGFLFGWLMNLWFWLSFVYPLTWKTLLAANLTSIWFDALHAAGNLLFAVFLTVPMANMLLRFRDRFDVEYVAPDGEDASKPLSLQGGSG